MRKKLTDVRQKWQGEVISGGAVFITGGPR